MFRRAPALLLVALILLGGSVAAAPDRGAARLDQALRDLAGDLRLLTVAARPGDEDGATLAYLRRDLGAETTVVFMTRGEGIENEAGDEWGEALARLRAREALAAAEHTGANVRFLDRPDFGFSKSAEEVFEVWDRDEALRDLVRIVREIRPHVMLTPHDPESARGQHRAVALLAEEALGAAADPERFATDGEPFLVGTLYGPGDEEHANLRADTGRLNPVRGLSYREIGLAARLEYRSLGPPGGGAGPGIRWFRALGRHALVEGPETFEAYRRNPAPEWMGEEARAGTREEILARLLEMPRSEKRDRAIAAAYGAEISLEFVALERPVSRARVTVRNRGVLPFRVSRPSFVPSTNGILEPGSILEPGESVRRDFVFVPEHDRWRCGAGARVSPPDGGEEVGILTWVDYEVPSPVSIRISERGRLFRPVLKESDLLVAVANHSAEAREVELEVEVIGTGRLRTEPPAPFPLAPGGEATVAVHLVADSDLEDGLYRVEVRAKDAPPASTPIRVLDVEVAPDLVVGVVRTAGDEVYRFLRDLELNVDLLSDEDLRFGDLSEYRTIWLGHRAFHFRPVLAEVHPRLAGYVRGGGHLVVNGSTERDWMPALAPHLLEVGSGRVTREDAPIDFGDADHPLFMFPNEVATADFEGWTRSRGRGFPSEWDEVEYRELLSTFDPGESPAPGLLFAGFGEGTFVYTCLSWHRQVRILNPAALKMVANLVSYPWRR